MSLQRTAPRVEPAASSPAPSGDWRAALVALFAEAGLAGVALDWREGGETFRLSAVGRCEGRASEVAPLLIEATGRLDLCLHGRALDARAADAAMARLDAACRAQIAFEDRVAAVVSDVLASGQRRILLCRSSGALLDPAPATTSGLEGSGLTSRAGRLLADDPQDQFGLRQALCAAALEGQRRRLAMSADGQRVFVEVRPVLGPPEALRPLAVVLLPPMRPPQAERCEVLQRLFGLTAAEAAIGVAIVDGVRVDDIARARRVAVSTVRSQVKSVLHKAGVSRQVELVQRIAEAG